MFAWLQTPAVTPVFSLWCLFMVILMLSAALVPQMVKNPSANAGDPGLVPGLGKSPGGGYGNPLQYSCLENPVDRGSWRAAVHGVTKSQTRLMS